MDHNPSLGKDDSCRHDIYLGFGSNIGIPEKNLLEAIRFIKEEIPDMSVVNASGVYLSSPVGNGAQPYFLNCVVLFKMTKAEQNAHETYRDFAEGLLCKLKNIEEKMGRKKENARNLPRVIDVDILLIYDNCRGKSVKLNLPNIKLPHPEIRNRKFVLLPLLDICGELKSIKKSLQKIDQTDAGFRQKVAPYGRFNDDLTKIIKIAR